MIKPIVINDQWLHKTIIIVEDTIAKGKDELSETIIQMYAYIVAGFNRDAILAAHPGDRIF